jgi:hypothetical protein
MECGYGEGTICRHEISTEDCVRNGKSMDQLSCLPPKDRLVPTGTGKKRPRCD